MKIYIYGDSNTWGYIPSLIPYGGDDSKQPRYKKEELWWYGLSLQNEVYVDGNNGRTTAYDHLAFPNKNASKTINDDLKKVPNDIDLLIIMLGSNDLKTRYYASASDIALHENELIQIICAEKNCKVLVLCPPYIKVNESIIDPPYENGEEKIDELYEELKKLCKENNYQFGDFRNCDLGIDGLHLSPLGHKQAREIIEKIVK